MVHSTGVSFAEVDMVEVDETPHDAASAVPEVPATETDRLLLAAKGVDYAQHPVWLSFRDAAVEQRYCDFQYIHSGFIGGKLYAALALGIMTGVFLIFHKGGPTWGMFGEDYWIPMDVAWVFNFLLIFCLFAKPLWAYREVCFLAIIFTHWPAFATVVMLGKSPHAYSYPLIGGCFYFCTFIAQARFVRIFPFLSVTPLLTLVVVQFGLSDYWASHALLEICYWPTVFFPLVGLMVFERRSRKAFIDIERGSAGIALIEHKIAAMNSMVAHFFPATPTLDLLLDNSADSARSRCYPQTVIVVTDIAGFTAWTSHTEPAAVIEMVTELFTSIDSVSESFNVEKVSTVGDSFFGAIFPAAAEKDADGAQSLAQRGSDAADFAFAILHFANGLQMRIGVHAGDVVGGFVGFAPPKFDLFGPAVEVAQTMESSGRPGMVHLSTELIAAVGAAGAPIAAEPTSRGVLCEGWLRAGGERGEFFGGFVRNRIADNTGTICEVLVALGERQRRANITGERRLSVTNARRKSMTRVASGLLTRTASGLLTRTASALGPSGMAASPGATDKAASTLAVPGVAAGDSAEATTPRSGGSQERMASFAGEAGGAGEVGDGGAGEEAAALLATADTSEEDEVNEDFRFHPLLLVFGRRAVEQRFGASVRASGINTSSAALFVLLSLMLLIAHVNLGCFDSAQDRLTTGAIALLITFMVVYVHHIGTAHRYHMAVSVVVYQAICTIAVVGLRSDCGGVRRPYYIGNICGMYWMVAALSPQFVLDVQLRVRVAVLFVVTLVLGPLLALYRRAVVQDEALVFDWIFPIGFVAFSVVSFFADQTLRTAFATTQQLRRAHRSTKGKHAAAANSAMEVMLPAFVVEQMVTQQAQARSDGSSSAGGTSLPSTQDSQSVAASVYSEVSLLGSESEPGQPDFDLSGGGAQMMWEYECLVVMFVTFHAADEAYDMVNEMIQRCEVVADEHGVQKVKTIGTTLLFVDGIDSRVSAEECLVRTIDAARRMQATVFDRMARVDGFRWTAGVNTGPAFGAVIGESGLVFDVFGDTVNTASRMMSTAPGGTIQLSLAAKNRLMLADDLAFGLAALPSVEVKGKGTMEVFAVRDAEFSAFGGGMTPPTPSTPAFAGRSPRNLRAQAAAAIFGAAEDAAGLNVPEASGGDEAE
jgi:class 3 adenylate cyclase